MTTAGRPGGQRKRCCLVSLSDIARDPRICRHGDALHEAGWTVIGLGAAGSGGMAGFDRLDWEIREAVLPPPSRTLWRRGLRIAQVAAAGRLAPATLSLCERFSYHRALIAAGQDIRAEVFIANDWQALPVAFALADASPGAKVIYDSHELATEERAELLSWSLLYGRLACAVESRLIRRSAAVFTVSDGIADIMRRLYRLSEAPHVVRNIPPFVSAPFREPDPGVVAVLYQGRLAPGRGIDVLLDSVPLWRSDYRLTVRGPGDPAYVRELRAWADRLGVGKRIRFEEPCPPREMIGRANACDVGIHPLVATNRSNRHALPNKLFEYIMAGLAVCVSDLPDMARVITDYRCGALIDGESAAAIADTLNRLGVSDIAEAKRHSLAAARELCWEGEKQRLLAVVDSVHPGGHGSVMDEKGRAFTA